MKDIINHLKDIANELDSKGLVGEASGIDDVIIKIAEKPYKYKDYEKDAIPIEKYPKIDYLKVLNEAREAFKSGQNRMDVMSNLLYKIANSFGIKNIDNRKHANLIMTIENIVDRAQQLNERNEDLQDKSEM